MKLRVGLYRNDPHANVRHFVRCLRDWQMPFQFLDRAQLPALRPGDFDVLLLHGGWYGIDRVPGQNQSDKHETPETKACAAAVRRFVRAGGGVVGVCCGAFNVVWLGLIRADISRAAGTGPHSLEVVNDRHPIVAGVIERATGRKDRKWKPVPITRINGPIFFPKNPRQLVLSYDWEHRLGAVLAGHYGKGRVVAISPHPELKPRTAIGILKNALTWSATCRARRP